MSALVAYAVDPDGHRRLLVLVERADGDDPSMAPSSTHNTSGGRGRSGKDTSGKTRARAARQGATFSAVGRPLRTRRGGGDGASAGTTSFA